MHGGKSLRGVAHPNFKSGRYAADVLSGLVDGYVETLQDTQINILDDEIALATTYLKKTLREGESLVRWGDALKAGEELEGALAVGEARAVTTALQSLMRILQAGTHDYAHRAEVYRALEAKKKLVEAEHKHRVDKGMALTYEQAMTQVAALVDILRRRIKDRDLLSTITDDIADVVRGIEGDPPKDPDLN